MWSLLLFCGFFLFKTPVLAQENPVSMGINQAQDQLIVEIKTQLADYVMENQTDEECRFGIDYNNNGVTNSFDYIMCRLGGIFHFYYPKKEYKNNYVLILYPSKTVALKSKLESGGQFEEVPNEGNYVAMDVYFDSSDNMRSKIINLIGGDDESEIKKPEMKTGEYMIELIYQSSGTYYSIRKEINWP